MYWNAVGRFLYSSATPVGNAWRREGNIVFGTGNADLFNGNAGDYLLGDAGDDTYVLWSTNVTMREDIATGGIDTVIAKYWGPAVLQGGIENLVLSSRGITTATGNALDNIITAASGIGVTIDGGAGNDVIVGGAGGDIFKVVAGNGSDAIVGFEAGHDIVRLQNYGITSFAQVRAASIQDGADLRIALSGGEVLVLRDTRLADLQGFDFGFAMPIAPPAAGTTTLDGAGRAQNWNGWYVLNNAWGSGGMRSGIDYTISSNFNRADMTAGTTFTWSMPYSTALGLPILAYPEVIFGVPPNGSYANNPTDRALVFPVKLANLTSLVMDYDVDFTGNTGGYNVAYDIWFTSVPNGDRSTISNEVMIWVHKGDFAAVGTVLGLFVDNGVTYTIYHTGTYTALVADRDVPAGDINLRAIFTHLQVLGILHSNEYLASIEFGAEVVSGVGSLTINNLDLVVQSNNGLGRFITKTVTGAGTTVVETRSLAEQFTTGSERSFAENGIKTGRIDTIVTDDRDVTQQIKTLSQQLLGYDQVTIRADGAMVRDHYSARGAFEGAEVTSVADTGITTVEHYDAGGVFTGAETTQAVSPTRTETWHYDANFALLGGEVAEVQPDGRTRTQYLDASYHVTGYEIESTGISGARTVDHYDTAGVYLGRDVMTTDARAIATTLHYDADGAYAGKDVEVGTRSGVISQLSYDGANTLVARRYEGTDIDDTIHGSRVTNDVHGGRGSDTIVAGKRGDVIWFDTAIGNGDVDAIRGFEVAQDRIVLDHAVFAGAGGLGTLSASAFAAGSVALEADDRILFDAGTGSLYYDADGAGGVDAILFATIGADRPLTAEIFTIG